MCFWHLQLYLYQQWHPQTLDPVHDIIMQASSSQDLVTQFTEDAFTQEDRVCQRSRCQALIRKGSPCHYVSAYNPAQPGKFVCGECYQWYQKKPATTTWQVDYTKDNPTLLKFDLLAHCSNLLLSALPDPQTIRRSITASWSKGRFIST